MKKFLKTLFYSIVIIFALVGFVFSAVFIGMQFGIFNVRGSSELRNEIFSQTYGNTANDPTLLCTPTATNSCPWNATAEWGVVKGGLTKDTALIERASQETGVDARMIAAVVAPEQLRYFTSERESYKKIFEPLKILASLSKFSLGVSGIKQDTANEIERYALSPSSNRYPGDGMSQLFSYPPGVDHDTELFRRLTDIRNHYYQYLYTALYIKEIESEWSRAGYDVTHNPNVIVTLFNVGFYASLPNPSPITAGSPITVGGITYLYGELGSLIYNSNELVDVFPKQ